MNKTKRNIWKDGIMGVVVGDALGCPVEFSTTGEREADPVTGMRSGGTFRLPAGSWTDDSSLTLAGLDSLVGFGFFNPADILYRFALWLTKGEYTPFGVAFDIGNTSEAAISSYIIHQDWKTCGGTLEWDNGNGSLMRIMPFCLFCAEQEIAGKMSEAAAMRTIHEASALTHNHMRAKIACGLYYFMVREILWNMPEMCERQRAEKPGAGKPLVHLLQRGLNAGFAFYEENELADATVAWKREDIEKELVYFKRIRDLRVLAQTPKSEMRSGGYVIETIEAVLWSLARTQSFCDALLDVVNLGHDTDTTAAIAGGLAGLYYGYDEIPKDWIAVIQRREWIESLCARMDDTRSGSDPYDYPDFDAAMEESSV